MAEDVQDQGVNNPFSRQQHIVPESVHSMEVCLVGLGAIGRQVALPLSSMGIGTLHLVDFDKVDESNVASQMHYSQHIGQFKTNAVATVCMQLNRNPSSSAVEHRQPWNPAISDRSKAIFCCVDTMSARKEIFEAFLDNPRNKLMLDARMLAETMRILVVDKDIPETLSQYWDSLFDDEEAATGRCTSDGVVYTAAIAGGLLCREFIRWARGDMACRTNYLLNLLSMDLFDITPVPASV